MDGLLLVNKPLGMTSRDVVNSVSQILKTKKIGHTGTLDPMATGVLVLCVGKATKLVEYITSDDKTYLAGVVLGFETDTLDITGQVVKHKNINDFNVDDIKHNVSTFKTSYYQEVPKYSAIKINGKKLYEYARSNTAIDLPNRLVHIYDIEVDEAIIREDGIHFNLMCHVSKGTYIRSLIRDIGVKLNTYATMTSLVRVKQGLHRLDDCYTLDDIKEGHYHLIPFDDIYFKNRFNLNDSMYNLVKHGCKINLKIEKQIIFMYYQDHLVAIYEPDDTEPEVAKAVKVFV